MIPRPSPTQASFKRYVVSDFKRICKGTPTHHFRQTSGPLAGKAVGVNGMIHGLAAFSDSPASYDRLNQAAERLVAGGMKPGRRHTGSGGSSGSGMADAR